MATFIAIAAAFALIGFFLLRGKKSSEKTRATIRPHGDQPHAVRPASPPNATSAAIGSTASGPAPFSAGQSSVTDARTAPEALATFTPTDTTDSEARRQLGARLEAIPRPPRSFHQLVSPAFLATATSEDLSNLVMGEPLIAAKVLKRVNSPLYGLQKPVVQVGQAVTFLGLTNVRAICLQYMLDDSFKAESPELQKIFDDIWNASSIASDLCFRLAQKLNLPNPGVIATYAVLSYVGHLAAALLLPKEVAVATSGADLLERARAEQQHLGITAGELTRLLMETWTLPPELTEGVTAVDRVLFVSSDSIEDKALAEAAALCYFSARVGEKLVLGQLKLPLAIENMDNWGPDFFHFTHYLQLPHLQGLTEAAQAKDLNTALAALLSGISAPAGE